MGKATKRQAAGADSIREDFAEKFPNDGTLAECVRCDERQEANQDRRAAESRGFIRLFERRLRRGQRFDCGWVGWRKRDRFLGLFRQFSSFYRRVEWVRIDMKRPSDRGQADQTDLRSRSAGMRQMRW